MNVSLCLDPYIFKAKSLGKKDSIDNILQILESVFYQGKLIIDSKKTLLEIYKTELSKDATGGKDKLLTAIVDLF